MLAPYSAKLDWNEYLRSAYVVEGVGQHIDRLGRGFQKLGKVVSSSIDANTTRIVASQQAVADILERGMEGIQDRLRYQQSVIEDLQAEYSYQSGLQLDQLVIANTTLEGIKEVLENHYRLQARPDIRDHLDKFLTGCKRLERGLLEEALESFHNAESIDRTHFFTQFHLGKLYLYGVEGGEDVIDLERAEKHFRLAVRYGIADASLDEKMKPLAAEAYLHASMACYLQAMKLDAVVKEAEEAEKVEAQLKYLSEAFALASKAAELNPCLGEAFYCKAKYRCVGEKLMYELSDSIDDLTCNIQSFLSDLPLINPPNKSPTFGDEAMVQKVLDSIINDRKELSDCLDMQNLPPEREDLHGPVNIFNECLYSIEKRRKLSALSRKYQGSTIVSFFSPEKYDVKGIWSFGSERLMLEDVISAIKLNRNYAVKISLDTDFDLSRESYNELIQDWTANIKIAAEDKLGKVKKSLEGTVMEFIDAEIFLKEYRALQTLHEKIQNMPPIRLEEVAPSYYGRTDNYKQKELTSAGESLKRQRETIESQITSGYKQLAVGEAFLDVNKAWDLADQAERNYTSLKEDMAKEPARLILGRKQELATIRRLVSGYGNEVRSRTANGQCTVCGQEGLFGSAFMKKKDGLCFCKEHKERRNHVAEAVFRIFGRSAILPSRS